MILPKHSNGEYLALFAISYDPNGKKKSVIYYGTYRSCHTFAIHVTVPRLQCLYLSTKVFGNKVEIKPVGKGASESFNGRNMEIYPGFPRTFFPLGIEVIVSYAKGMPILTFPIFFEVICEFEEKFSAGSALHGL